MVENKILDIAHVSFLEMIRAMAQQNGTAATKGTLVRIAMASGAKMETVDFPSMDAFAESIEAIANPVTKVEGKAAYLGNGLFGLPACPFAESIGNFKMMHGELPAVFTEVTAEFNKPGPQTDSLRVGNGAGVSPFCAVHQTLRSSLAAKITIGGKPVAIYQLGCKSGSGAKGFADRFIEEGGWPKQLVDKTLDANMCCYGVKVQA